MGCPNCHFDKFLEMSVEVGGFGFDTATQFRPLQPRLPLYIPKHQHSSNRSVAQRIPWLAVDFRSLLRLDRKREHLLPRFSSASEMKAAHCVSDDTNVLLIGATDDPQIELFWEYHQVDGLAAALHQMGIAAATTPNYSFFTNVNRTRVLHNRKRMLLVAKRLSDAGLPVALHLNALTRADWDRWFEILNAQQGMCVVAKEFQTGNKIVENGEKAWDELSRLEQRLGRPLHVVAVGGAQFLSYAAQRVTSVTLVDSAVAMKTSVRQRAVLRRGNELIWRPSPTLPREPLDDLWAWNARVYGRWVEQTITEARGNETADPRQIELPLLAPRKLRNAG